MVFKNLFQSQSGNKRKQQKKSGSATKPAVSSPPSGGLCSIFREGLQLKDGPSEQMAAQVKEGVEFFNSTNEGRINHAFESFDLSMRYALFEIIYLLHVNDQKLSELTFKVFTTNKKKASDQETTVNLYMEGAPAGVKGIGSLSPVFQEEFKAYIQKTFDDRIFEVADAPIEGIYSIGSIGTVGHKNIASDLDLEVQYNLEPSEFDASDWTDESINNLLLKEHGQLIKRYYQKKGIEPASITAEQKKKASIFFKKRIEQKYPILYQHLVAKKSNIEKEIRVKNDQKMRFHLQLEMIELVRSEALLKKRETFSQQEELLKQRILKIQDYIQTKFPDAEVYLFPFSRTDLQKGYFGSTLDSKESSGGAYELILNYETLMPGIYFTPVIPSHFLFNQEINNSSRQFENFTRFLQFGLIDFCKDISCPINHQGPTPDLDPIYAASHQSAAYWEAFKASSGNLPKATLNILRYEMLLEKKLGKTTIQLIKQPQLLNELVPEVDAGETDSDQFTPADILQLEEEFPAIQYDPWWLRYKSLKIAYGSSGLMRGISDNEAVGISDIIDYAFALHIRLSDVFTKPGDTRKFKKHREKVLLKFLSRAFPEDSDKRTRLTATFIGDVQTVSKFEADLRSIFLKSVERIQEKVKEVITLDDKKTAESEIWHHYYMQAFKPGPNVVQRSILNHLQIPRGRLQIGVIQKKGWFFRSLQRGQSVGKRFESSILSLLPEEIMLLDNTSFLMGLVYCVINGNYGIFNKGTLNETRTEIEYDRKHTNLGSNNDNQLAFVRPDQIERIMKQITELFDNQYVSYLDCIQTERSVNEVMIFVNLLKYGRVSLIYRDSLNTIFVDQFNIPNFEEYIDSYMSDYSKMLQAKSLHILLRKFFQSRKIDIEKVKLKTWVNSNCVETSHAATKYEAKENELANHFHAIIMKVHAAQKSK